MAQRDRPSSDRLALSIDDVRVAARRLAGVAHRTPVLTSRALDARIGGQVLLKAECFQRVGVFKFRGAYNAIASMDERARARGLVSLSSGNHAQAVALAARLLGTHAVVLMPRDAPLAKRAATDGYGAEVVEFDRWNDDRESLLAAVAAERGLEIVRSYDDHRVMAGAGTVALELFEDVGELDQLLVCLGGGGLLSGCATVARAVSPRTRIVGVEPEASDDWKRSMAAGEPVTVTVRSSIADGQLLASPGRLTWPIVSALVDEVVTVSDEQIADAVRYCFERLRIVVEPSGASALAALLGGVVDGGGRRTGVTLSGGNVDAERYAALLTPSRPPAP